MIIDYLKKKKECIDLNLRFFVKGDFTPLRITLVRDIKLGTTPLEDKLPFHVMDYFVHSDNGSMRSGNAQVYFSKKHVTYHEWIWK